MAGILELPPDLPQPLQDPADEPLLLSVGAV